MKMALWSGVLALSAASMAFGQITGKVMLDGKAPDMPEVSAIKVLPDCAKQHKEPVYDEKVVVGDKNELANVVVYIQSPKGVTLGKAASTPAVLDQKGCVYTPHVVAVCVDQPLLVKNSDMFLHNVHTLPIDNAATNIAMPNVGEKKFEPYKAVEQFKVKCDVHPWMYAWIVVCDNPYFGVSSAADKNTGQYSIDTKGLPDGEYTFIAWHEFYGQQEVKAKVAGGKAEVNFKFSATRKTEAKPTAEIKLASACCDKK